MFFLSHIWLIPLLPALGAATMFFFGRKLQKTTINAVCVGAVVLRSSSLVAQSGNIRITLTTILASLTKTSSTLAWQGVETSLSAQAGKPRLH